MDELEESLNNGKVDVKLDTCAPVPQVKKHFLGVRQNRNKWQARVRHPKLKFEISLGTYSSAEEAALAVKKKKADYAEIFKIGDIVNVETSGDAFAQRKLPSGLCRRGFGRWSARIWHPGLRKSVSLGSYHSPEEAAAAWDNKRAEFLEMYEPRSMHKVMGKLENEVPKMPVGVRKLQSGKFGARFRDPESRATIWLGTFGTFEEAVKSIEKKKALVNAERKRAVFDGYEANDEGAVKGECELGHGFLTSVVNSNEADLIAQGNQQNTCNASNFDEAERKWAELNIYDVNGGTMKRESEFGRSYPSSVANSNETSLMSEGDQQRTCNAYDFDEAVNSGFINEYGELMGMYSEVDRQMELA